MIRAPSILAVSEHTGWAHVVCVSARDRRPFVITRRRIALIDRGLPTDKDELPPLHDQTTVTAKLHCGRTSVGYAWFCDLIETVQSKVLFWLPS